MVIKKIRKRFLRVLGKLLVSKMVIVLCKTLRIEEINKNSIKNLELGTQNFVFAFWHGKMLVPWYILKKHSPSALISQSKDGALLADLLTKWNYKVRRGSSSKDGKEVLNELISDARNFNSIAITPDGPRGPKNKLKAGAVIVAKKAEIPLVLIGVCYKRKFVLNSWDRFEIPHIFSKVKIVYSNPYYIDKDLSYEVTDRKIKEIQNKFDIIQNRAEQNC